MSILLMGFTLLECPPCEKVTIEVVAQHPVRALRIEFRRAAERRHLVVDEVLVGRSILLTNVTADHLTTRNLPKRTKLRALESLRCRVRNDSDGLVFVQALLRAEVLP